MPVRKIAWFVAMAALLLTFAGTAQEAHGQPNSEILRDKFILGLSRALKANDYPKALKFIDRLEKLGGDLPPAIDYFRGEAYFHTGRYGEAQRALNRYVEKTGRKGRYYQKSLEFMLAAEEKAEKAEARERPGRVFRDCPECPEMVVVSAGSFMMGSPSYEAERDDDEGPRHRVTIPKPFAVGKYEVTFAEWDACVADGGCRGRRPADRGWGRARRPVINVSWNDAKTYVRWLSNKTGQEYRLLSEAEWEYVARAGTTSRYSWGDDIGRNRANCDGCGSRWDDKQTAPAGSFAPNVFGLHDAHGNVYEWVEDCWNASYAGAPPDGSAWTGGDCGLRVLRGGSWDSEPRYLRSAYRNRDWAGVRDYFSGFRVARTLAL